MTSIMYEDLTPTEVVAYLDRYIVGQVKAKRAVAVALRNRLRRKRLDPKIAEEVIPKNILMIGPTGVGKTEIARRLAALVNAPFVKVEATKFTEVGYVGRDVESMIRDLVEVAVHMVKARHTEAVQSAAAERAEERLLDLLLPLPRKQESMQDFVKVLMGGVQERIESPREREDSGTRERLREMLHAGKLDTREVEVEVAESAVANVPVLGVGLDEMGINLSEMLGNLLPKRMKRKRMSVSSARVLLQAEEAEKLIDMESVVQEALTKVQEEGIVFLDELDKVASQDGAQHGPDVSREGVQRDLLPIVEGSTVMTKYGPVKTDYILFIAAGAFHRVKPSDLVPELQGRFPIRVELSPLSEDDLGKILTEPENSLLRQYKALLGTEGVSISFCEDAVAEIANIAAKMNAEMEDIGARRLHTVMEQLLEDVSFKAPELEGSEVLIDAAFVRERLEPLVQSSDLKKYLL